MINLPLKRKQSQVFIENDVAQKIVPVEVKPGVSLSAVTGLLNVKDNVHNVEVILLFFYLCIQLKKSCKPVYLQNFKGTEEVFLQKNITYEWSSINVSEFLQKLAQEGIHDAKVESSGNSVMIHFVSDCMI